MTSNLPFQRQMCYKGVPKAPNDLPFLRKLSYKGFRRLRGSGWEKKCVVTREGPVAPK
jgi:hypothetical protein